MNDLLPITESEQLTLAIFNMLGNDVVAVKLAREFVGSSQLRFQLLQMSVSEEIAIAKSTDGGNNVDWVVIARKAVDSAQHKQTAFQ